MRHERVRGVGCGVLRSSGKAPKPQSLSLIVSGVLHIPYSPFSSDSSLGNPKARILELFEARRLAEKARGFGFRVHGGTAEGERLD